MTVITDKCHYTKGDDGNTHRLIEIEVAKKRDNNNKQMWFKYNNKLLKPERCSGGIYPSFIVT